MASPSALDRIAIWILRHAALLTVTTLGLTVAAGLVIAVTPQRTSLLQTFTANSAAYRAFERRAEILGGHSEDVLYVATTEGSRLFTAETFNALRRAGREIADLPEIASVATIADAPWLAPDRPLSLREVAAKRVLRRRILAGETPEVDERLPLPTYWPDDPRRQADLDFGPLRTAMLDQDPFAAQLLSADGRSQAIVIRMARAADLDPDAQARLRRTIETIVRKQGLGRAGIYSAGIVVMQGWTVQEATRSVLLLFPLGAAIICFLVFKIFRQLGIVVLTLAIAGVAIVWSTAAAALAFGEITILLSVVPLLVLTISTSDAIHMASAYGEELDRGVAPHVALTKVLREVGWACILTSVTTFVGFVSLMAIPAAAVRHLALATGVGVAAALLLVLVFVPLGLTRFPLRTTVRDEGERLPINRWNAAFVRSCRRASLEHPWPTIGTLGLLLVGAAVASAGLRIDVDIPGRFASDHPSRRSVDFFDRQFSGTSTIEVFLERESGSLLTPDTIARMAEFERRIAELPEVQSVVSLPTVFRVAFRILGIPSDTGLPETEPAADASIRLLEEAGNQDVRQIISPDRRLARLSLQVLPTRLMEVVRVADRVSQIAAEVFPDTIEVDVSGVHPIVGRVVGEIVRGEYQGIAICFVCVMATVALGARSIRLSLLAVLPNVLPLVLLGGLLALTTDYVDCDILMVAILSFGLAVDDTIHFVHRYQTERGRGLDKRQALETTFDYTGQAIIRTTVVLGLGLAPFALSGYLSIWMLGTHVVFVLVAAVLADLLLLPASILLFDRDSPPARGEAA
jgi:predicted RND superfamily exporter protein